MAVTSVQASALSVVMILVQVGQSHSWMCWVIHSRCHPVVVRWQTEQVVLLEESPELGAVCSLDFIDFHLSFLGEGLDGEFDGGHLVVVAEDVTA